MIPIDSQKLLQQWLAFQHSARRIHGDDAHHDDHSVVVGDGGGGFAALPV